MTQDEPGAVTIPVLILGGGPVGLATAIELSLQGVPVIMVEPRIEISHSRPRAKTTSMRSMELFRRWGVADELRDRAALPIGWSTDVTFCSTVTGAEIARISGCFGMDLTGSDLVAEPGQQVPPGDTRGSRGRGDDASSSAERPRCHCGSGLRLG